jgi:hypothetical protein
MEWGNSSRRRPGGRRTTGQRVLCALLVALALAPLPAAAQQRVQGRGMMRSEILAPVTVQNDADMDFGDIIPGTANGSVVMTPGNPTATCTTNAGIIRTGPCKAARFDGELPFLFGLEITKPAGNQINLVGPAGATMRLHDFTFAKGSGLMLGGSLTDPTYFVIGGTFTVYVGGTLDVARTQRPGIYNGTFTLSFNYN